RPEWDRQFCLLATCGTQLLSTVFSNVQHRPARSLQVFSIHRFKPLPRPISASLHLATFEFCFFLTRVTTLHSILDFGFTSSVSLRCTQSSTLSLLPRCYYAALNPRLCLCSTSSIPLFLFSCTSVSATGSSSRW